jgi:hypothetical protein
MPPGFERENVAHWSQRDVSEQAEKDGDSHWSPFLVISPLDHDSSVAILRSLISQEFGFTLQG